MSTKPGAVPTVQVSVYDRRATLLDSFTYARDVHLPRKLRGRNPNPELHRRAVKIVQPVLDARGFDAILVVNGAVLGSEIFASARRRGVPVVLWLQDELSRLIFHTIPTLGVFTAVGTYSHRDVEFMRSSGINAALVPNGFDNRLTISGEPRGRDVVFIGARDAHRESVLMSLSARGLPVAVYGNEWSTRMRHRARALSWTRPPLKNFPNVSRETASQLYYDALCAVNIHVPGIQDGINPRTFETNGVGGLQATDRFDIGDYYTPGEEILLYSSAEELGEMIAQVQRDPSWGRAVRQNARRRTLADHTIVHRCRQLVDMM